MGSHEVTSGNPKVTLWCLHGAVGMAADWQSFSHQMARLGYDVRAVDLWRFLACCPKSLNETAAAINAEARALPGRHILIGYSMGGRLALHALLESNHPWHAAVIISAHTGLRAASEKSDRLKKDTEWSVLCHQNEWHQFLDLWQSQDVLQGPAPQWPDRGALHLRRKEIARSFIDWSLGVQDDLLATIPHIHIPVLWLTGARDPKFTRIAEQALPLLPSATHLLLPDAGHRLPWEQPEAFVEIVREFLART